MKFVGNHFTIKVTAILEVTCVKWLPYIHIRLFLFLRFSVIWVRPCWSATFSQTGQPENLFFCKPSTYFIGVSCAEPLSDGDTNTPASVVKGWWGDKCRHRNTQKEYIHTYIYDRLLPVFVYQIHSQGFGQLEAIAEDICPRCHTVGPNPEAWGW